MHYLIWIGFVLYSYFTWSIGVITGLYVPRKRLRYDRNSRDDDSVFSTAETLLMPPGFDDDFDDDGQSGSLPTIVRLSSSSSLNDKRLKPRTQQDASYAAASSAQSKRPHHRGAAFVQPPHVHSHHPQSTQPSQSHVPQHQPLASPSLSPSPTTPLPPACVGDTTGTTPAVSAPTCRPFVTTANFGGSRAAAGPSTSSASVVVERDAASVGVQGDATRHDSKPPVQAASSSVANQVSAPAIRAVAPRALLHNNNSIEHSLK